MSGFTISLFLKKMILSAVEVNTFPAHYLRINSLSTIFTAFYCALHFPCPSSALSGGSTSTVQHSTEVNFTKTTLFQIMESV